MATVVHLNTHSYVTRASAISGSGAAIHAMTIMLIYANLWSSMYRLYLHVGITSKLEHRQILGDSPVILDAPRAA